MEYDDLAENYERWRNETAIVYWAEEIARLGCLQENSKVLDIGCGTGRFLKFLNKGDLYGLDKSEKMIGYAKERANASLIIGDATDLPFASDMFDLVYMCFVIHHLDMNKAIREAYRVLKSSGKFIIITSSHERIIRWGNDLCLNKFPRFVEIDIRRFPKISDIVKEMEKIGFSVSVKQYNREVEYDKKEFIEKVRNKFVSTLTLLTEKEFKEGFTNFLKCINKYEDKIKNFEDYTLIIGSR